MAARFGHLCSASVLVRGNLTTHPCSISLRSSTRSSSGSCSALSELPWQRKSSTSSLLSCAALQCFCAHCTLDGMGSKMPVGTPCLRVRGSPLSGSSHACASACSKPSLKCCPVATSQQLVRLQSVCRTECAGRTSSSCCASVSGRADLPCCRLCKICAARSSLASYC